MGDANDWAQVLADNFIPDNNLILYFLGDAFYVLTGEGLVVQDEWPYPLTNAEKADLLAMAIKGGPHTFHAGTSADTWRRKLDDGRHLNQERHISPGQRTGCPETNLVERFAVGYEDQGRQRGKERGDDDAR